MATLTVMAYDVVSSAIGEVFHVARVNQHHVAAAVMAISVAGRVARGVAIGGIDVIATEHTMS
jgi:hypothetical protein